jgi:arylsulfatase A-like enzyme
MNASQGRESRKARAVDLGSILYLVLVTATLFGAVMTRSAVHDTRLGIWARACLFGLELACAGLVVPPLVGFAVLVGKLGARLHSAPLKHAVRAVALGVAVVLAAAYGVSWALFSNLGAFLDRESLALASVDSLMLLKHFIEVSPKQLVVLPLAAVLVVWLLPRLMDALLQNATTSAMRRIRCTAAAVFGASILAVCAGELGPARTISVVPDAKHGGYTTTAEVFRYSQRNASGPTSHMLISLASGGPSSAAPRASAEAQKPIPPSPIAITYRPQIDMKRYIASAQPASGSPNVIVLLVESLRPDVLRSTGGAFDVMPALDALARESRRFTQAYAESSHSDYADVCPMSSHYPLRSREHHYYPEHPAYPRVLIYDILKALGYRTAIVSSQNERWGGMYNYLDSGSLDHFFHAETFHTTVVDSEDNVFSKWAKDYGRSGKVDDRYTIDEAIRWIGESEHPFFIYINLQNAHFPYRTPDDFPKHFAPFTIDFPYTFGSFPIDKLEVVKNRYRNSLAYMDAQFERLLRFLRSSGRFDHTVLVVTGDNGEAFYEHGSAAHAGPLFQEAVRVPLIVHGPGVTAGDDPRPAQHIDVPPTVLGILGLSPHPSFQGIDLLRAPVDPRRSIFLLVQTLISQVALVREGYKLIADYGYGRYYLYDLAHDPGETKDIASSQPDRLRAMAGRLHAFRKAQLDYYADPVRFREVYPPVLSEDDPPP